MWPLVVGVTRYFFLFSDLFKPEFVWVCFFFMVQLLFCVGAIGMLLEQSPTLLGTGPSSLLPATCGVLTTMRVAAYQVQAECERSCSSVLQLRCLCLS